MGVHIAARLHTLAMPDERVLVSSMVKDLALGSDIRFEERGMHTLKGVPGEWFCPRRGRGLKGAYSL